MNSTIKKSIVICSAFAGLFLTACNNTQNKSSNMENYQHANTTSVYACPMHPEETGKQGDKCSKCGMDLEFWYKKTIQKT